MFYKIFTFMSECAVQAVCMSAAHAPVRASIRCLGPRWASSNRKSQIPVDHTEWGIV